MRTLLEMQTNKLKTGTASMSAHVSRLLKGCIIRDWRALEEQATARMKSINADSKCAYINVPFVSRGICTNNARWNIRQQRFDMLIVPVHKGDDADNIENAIIDLPKSQ